MIDHDAVVVGAGSGLEVANAAASKGLDVAIVEEGPLGGTCLNRGCIPSKMLIHRADVVESLKNSGKFGVESDIKNLDFRGIVEEVNRDVSSDAEKIEENIVNSDDLKLYKGEARFVEERTLEVGGEEVKGERVILAAGTRPTIPPLNGIEDMDYLTSREALKLKELPDHLVIVGGGYVAAELGHFFGSMGSDITIISDTEKLLDREDGDIADRFTEIYTRKYNVKAGFRAEKVEEIGGEVHITATNEDGEVQVSGDELLIAAGRRPNTDVLDVEKGGIETDSRGFVKTNGYLETTADDTWALGDIVDSPMFKHTANLEAEYVFMNAFTDHNHEVDYSAMPHAVFSSPQVAGVGKTEKELKEEGRNYVAGTYRYEDVAMGSAIKDEDGFVKAIVDPETGKILGCHIIGPEASILIHEVVVAMKSGDGEISNITNSVHIHPALNEVVQRAFESLF